MTSSISQGNTLLPAPADQPMDEDEEQEAAPLKLMMRAIEEDSAGGVDEEALPATRGRLDQQLTFLWAVHGVDYYAGEQLTSQPNPTQLNPTHPIQSNLI